MNTKYNQRFRQMDKRLKDTMLELLKTMDLEQITVKKLCETAQVNRSTFYAHYCDIFEMMEQMEEHLNEELLSSYAAAPPEELTPSLLFSQWPLIPFLRHIRKHSYFYKVALRQRKEFPLAQGFEPLWEQLIRPRCEAAGIMDEAEMMYYFVYFQAGFTMVLRRWVDTGCQESEEKIAGMLQNCIPEILQALS